MTALALLVRCCRARIVLEADGDALAFDAPTGVAVPVDELREHKAELLAILADFGAVTGAASLLVSVDDDRRRYALLAAFEKRQAAGVAGGLSRPEADALAFDELAAAIRGGAR